MSFLERFIWGINSMAEQYVIVPLWSEFIRQEAERVGYPYVDMVSDFPQRLAEAEALLTFTT